MEKWYVVQTKPRKEEQARDYLSSKGVEVFSPLMEQVQPRSGKIVTTLKPLFPNYIFSRFDLQKDYALVKWGRGVNRVIGFGSYPTPVPDGVIMLIMQRTDKDNVVRKALHLKCRDTVRVKAGPLKDLVGIFDRWVSDSERVRILLNMIGHGSGVELHYSLIEKVS